MPFLFLKTANADRFTYTSNYKLFDMVLQLQICKFIREKNGIKPVGNSEYVDSHGGSRAAVPQHFWREREAEWEAEASEMWSVCCAVLMYKWRGLNRERANYIKCWRKICEKCTIKNLCLSEKKHKHTICYRFQGDFCKKIQNTSLNITTKYKKKDRKTIRKWT